MTDKHIIIDGVDVSGCIYFKMNNKMPMCRACNSGVGSPYCEYHKDCYNKQLARKTQECEELKKANIHIDNNRMIKSNKLKKIEEYCREQNLKADYTACKILQIMDEVE